MKYERIIEPDLEEGQYYFVRFLDHNLRTKFEGIVSNEWFQFVGKFMEDTDNFHIFNLTECSELKDSDVFQIVKGTLIKLQEVEIDD